MKELKTQEEIIDAWDGDIDSPIVSIGCLTYNHESYLEDALNSFLMQETDFPFEILIHDDASTDNTQNIIKSYVERYPKIIKPIYQTENQYTKGISVVVECNLRRAKGIYIALCEGDDFWVDKYKLKIQKEFLDKNPEYVICYADVKAVDENGNAGDDFGGARKDLSSKELQQASSIFSLTVMYRNLLPAMPVELSNARYADLTLWSRLGEFGKGKFLPNIKPSIYRLHQGGIHSMQSQNKQIHMRLETMMALYSYWLNRSEIELANYFLEEVVVATLKHMHFRLFRNLLYRFIMEVVRLILLWKNRLIQKIKTIV